MLQNAHFLAKIGADTAENEQHFAEILPTDARTFAPLAEAAALHSPAERCRYFPDGSPVCEGKQCVRHMCTEEEKTGGKAFFVYSISNLERSFSNFNCSSNFSEAIFKRSTIFVAKSHEI